MFGNIWSNPDTLLLNLTNAGLGLLVVLAVGLVIFDIGIDLVSKMRHVKSAQPKRWGSQVLH